MKGEIGITIKPSSNVDKDYLEKISNKQIVLELDNQAYSWINEKLEAPYNNNLKKLIQHILELGLNEIITRIYSDDTLEEYEKLTKSIEKKTV